jgi:hypothetical protein
MIEAVCHCGAARLAAPTAPQVVTECNCSICRRTGARWAYYSPSEVSLPDGARTEAYVWGERMLAFHRCRTCGCLTHWQSLDATQGRMAINARMMDLDWEKVRIRPFDGANTWTYLDE